MKWLNKLSLWFKLLIHGFFFGLRGADQVMSQQSSGDMDEINHKIDLSGNVFNEMLQQEETQQVQEMRDKNYRVYREADKYDVSVTGMGSEEEDTPENDLHASATKKSTPDKPRTKQYETRNYKVVLIQNAKDYENDVVTKQKEAETGEAIDKRDSLIFDVTYKDDIIPRFYIERYLQKVVLKENKAGKQRVDLYFSQYARQFVKQDSLFVAELNRIFSGIAPKSDVLAINTLSFVTDKAFGAEDLHRITLSNLSFIRIATFDGSFVLEFSCIKDDSDIVEKFKTKSLDEKYASEAPKKESTDINALTRKIEKKENEEIDYEINTIKLD